MDNEGTERPPSLSAGSALERYHARLGALTLLSDERHRDYAALAKEGDPHAQGRLWEQGLIIAYAALQHAANTGGISKAVLYDEDAIQAVNTAVITWLDRWQPAKGGLYTFLYPRVVGQAKRYRKTDRRRGITGKAEDLAYEGTDGETAEPVYPDDSTFPDIDYDTLAGGSVETMAYEAAPDGLDAPPIEAMRLKLREALATLPSPYNIALERFYGVYGPAKGLREIAEALGASHPQQVMRIIQEGLHRLKISVTKPS